MACRRARRTPANRLAAIHRREPCMIETARRSRRTAQGSCRSAQQSLARASSPAAPHSPRISVSPRQHDDRYRTGTTPNPPLQHTAWLHAALRPPERAVPIGDRPEPPGVPAAWRSWVLPTLETAVAANPGAEVPARCAFRPRRPRHRAPAQQRHVQPSASDIDQHVAPLWHSVILWMNSNESAICHSATLVRDAERTAPRLTRSIALACAIRALCALSQP